MSFEHLTFAADISISKGIDIYGQRRLSHFVYVVRLISEGTGLPWNGADRDSYVPTRPYTCIPWSTVWSDHRPCCVWKTGDIEDVGGGT